ncbi:hypothetical protein DVH24_015610 [Malus domestica]|uniref:Uncharacterized protein n=1 Tax=Malus domestica TaxID=3750 RepID=A0A498HHK5_MALDO|nr:hypothetical protein DVH24_015610 [Malus domestica]
MGMLPDFQASTTDQPATARLTAQSTDLVDQLQNSMVEKPIVVHVIDPQPDTIVISVGSSTVPVEVVVESAVTAPLSNPKTTTMLFILDEEDDDDEPSPLVRLCQPSKQPSVTSLPSNKGKAVASSMPNPNQDDVHPLVKEIGDNTLEAVIEGPVIDPVFPAKPETMI